MEAKGTLENRYDLYRVGSISPAHLFQQFCCLEVMPGPGRFRKVREAGRIHVRLNTPLTRVSRSRGIAKKPNMFREDLDGIRGDCDSPKQNAGETGKHAKK